MLRHNGRSITFDWSGPAADNLQWAAFYSDCEHEVMPLVPGHRITLTYHLYYQIDQPRRGDALPLPLHSFPLYHDLQAALQTRGFMDSGGILGFYCNHAYPHANKKLGLELPMALKGVDLLVYAVCRSLGLETKARPILDPKHQYDEDNWFDMDSYRIEEVIEAHNQARGRLADFQKLGFHIPPYNHENMNEGSAGEESPDPIQANFRNTSDDPAQHPLAQHDLTLEYRNLGREIHMQQFYYAPTEPDGRMEYLKSTLEVSGLAPPPVAKAVRVGSAFHGMDVHGRVEEEWVLCSLPPFVSHSGGPRATTNTVILRTGVQAPLAQRLGFEHSLGHRDQALGTCCYIPDGKLVPPLLSLHLSNSLFWQYGNETSASCKYSAAAILVVVPPWSPERGGGGDGTATFSDGAASEGAASDEAAADDADACDDGGDHDGGDDAVMHDPGANDDGGDEHGPGGDVVSAESI